MSLIDAFSELKAKIGGEAALGSWLKMTQEWINDFVKVTGDFEWIHLDQKRGVEKQN